MRATVLRVACGGENHVPVSIVVNTVRGIEEARKKDLWVIAAEAEGGSDIVKAELKFPLAVVIGSEGKGIRPGIKRSIDMNFTLPMHGAELSYNVAVAAALFCYEVNRRRFYG